MSKFLAFILLILSGGHVFAQGSQKYLDFNHDGFTLSGVLNHPKDVEPKGIVLIIHGDGKTDAIAGNWWYDVRSAILEAGYATYMWDKMGCGKSSGTYKSGRPVEDEAFEVISAIKNLKEKNIEGASKIGLWGISRAGWINPIVIDKYKNIDFWISVSGVDDDETFDYLLAQNFHLEGYQEETIDLILSEWHNSILLSRSGANFTSYLSATENLRKNAFWNKVTNGGVSEKRYYEYQKILQESTLDKETGLPLYVENFGQMLSEIDIPVLALFGETDMTVDWKKTKNLYEQTLLVNTNLTISSFPNCNHNMWQAKTGAIYEFEDSNWKYVRCEGFLESITIWLNEL